MNASLSRTALRTALATLALLLIPLVAMFFTKEVRWGIEDFLVGGALLFAAGMTFSIATRRTRSAVRRLAIAALVLAALGIVWVQLAVGVFA